jgi:hypothetical protein
MVVPLVEPIDWGSFATSADVEEPIAHALLPSVVYQ